MSKCKKIIAVISLVLAVIIALLLYMGISAGMLMPTVRFDAENLTGEVTNGASGYLYGIAEEDIDSVACYTTMDGAFPEEVVMVKAKDGEALKRIEEKMNNRIAEVKVQSQSYDAENYAIAQKSEVQKNGNYIAMFLSPDYDSLVEIFKSNFEG